MITANTSRLDESDEILKQKEVKDFALHVVEVLDELRLELGDNPKQVLREGLVRDDLLHSASDVAPLGGGQCRQCEDGLGCY